MKVDDEVARTVSAEGYDRYFRVGRVHRDVYVDGGIFEQEMRHLFGSTWVFVAHESEIPKAGDYVTKRLGRRPVIVTRDENNVLHVLFNRCSHRGATLCREREGNARVFTCPYHAWSFGLDGRCTARALPQGFGPSTEDYPYDLGVAAHVESYRGFIFAAIRSDVSLIEYLAGARPMLDQWIDRNPGHEIVVRSGAMRFDVACNWKIVYDNAADGYHVPFSHESFLRMLSTRYGDVDIAYYGSDFDSTPLLVKDLGNGHTLLDQRPLMHAGSAFSRQHVLPGKETLWSQLNEMLGAETALALLDGSTGAGMNLNVFPNLMIIGNQIQVLEPVAVNRTVVHWYSTTLTNVPPEVNAIRMRMQEDFPSFGEVDDAANFEACQQGLEEVPEMEWVHIGRHLDSGRGSKDTDGFWKEPVSTDLHARTYLHAWRRIMEAASGPEGGA
jgi:phenylpropionate dioxygenase-like ring-hydroxylating dioxygenase large terminal subunit